jgi:hypothetical protein
MARTDDKIVELEGLVATLTERIDHARREMVDRERFAVMEERLNELKRTLEERRRLHWTVLPAIVGAISGGVVTIAVQLAL